MSGTWWDRHQVSAAIAPPNDQPLMQTTAGLISLRQACRRLTASRPRIRGHEVSGNSVYRLKGCLACACCSARKVSTSVNWTRLSGRRATLAAALNRASWYGTELTSTQHREGGTFIVGPPAVRASRCWDRASDTRDWRILLSTRLAQDAPSPHPPNLLPMPDPAGRTAMPPSFPRCHGL